MAKPKTPRRPSKPGHEPVGRPRRADLGKEYQLRMSEEDRVAWTECAARAGLTLAHWIRLQCVWAAGGAARIVRAEFVTVYPERTPTSVGVPAGHPIQAIRDAVADGVDVRVAVDELLADESRVGRLIAAEIKHRVDAAARRGDGVLVVDDPHQQIEPVDETKASEWYTRAAPILNRGENQPDSSPNLDDSSDDK